jgi:hypothetical protein
MRVRLAGGRQVQVEAASLEALLWDHNPGFLRVLVVPYANAELHLLSRV